VLTAGVDQRVVGMSTLSENFGHALLFQALCYEHRSGHWFCTLSPEMKTLP
jgi:hypothetical protein